MKRPRVTPVGTLRKTNPNARELLTEVLDRTGWWSTLRLIVVFLSSKHVDEVLIEFGFVLDRDVEGKPQTPSQVVELNDLEAVIKKGFDEGTIEWARGSNFLFHTVGTDLAFMLCNDADLHFASTDSLLLVELAHKIRSSGIKVYDHGKLI